MRIKLLFIASLLGLLAGCAQTANTTPTPFPTDYVPTAIALTAQGLTSTAAALSTPSLQPITETATVESTPLPPAATITPTPAAGFNYARIRFLEPGPAAKVVSPVNLQIIVVAGESETIKIDLFGEDGRVLFTQIARVNRYDAGAYETFRLPFEIRSAAEKGILQITTRDKFNRIEALNTLNFFILSQGVDENTPPGNVLYERVVMEEPAPKDATAAGGTIKVTGRIWPFDEPDHALFVELILPDGTIPGQRVLSLKGTDPQEFSTTLTYSIDAPVMALLTVRQMSYILRAPVYIYTQPILLLP